MDCQSGIFAAVADMTNSPIDNFGENIPPCNAITDSKRKAPEISDATERRERHLFIWEQRALAKSLIRIRDVLPNWAEYTPLESDCETSISFTNFHFHWAKVAFSRDRGDLTPYLELFTAFYKPKTATNLTPSEENTKPKEAQDLNTTDDTQPIDESPFVPTICISNLELEHICSTLDLYRSITSAVTHRSDYLMGLRLNAPNPELCPSQPTIASSFDQTSQMAVIPPLKQPASSSVEATTMSAKEAARLIAEMAKSGQGPDLPQKIWDAVGPREDFKIKEEPKGRSPAGQNKRPRLALRDEEFGEEEDRPQSGVPGVHWSARPRGWAATWTQGGKRKVKYFPAATYGEDRGRELAVEHKMNILKPHK
eukprot:GHVP01025857.1.p1 GENE.GHVP01025857.1~~GHVP01025857.1.p1  ORF type:complete len:368 (+),score=64.19 GHVP01025857.1:34-1137(+)